MGIQIKKSLKKYPPGTFIFWNKKQLNKMNKGPLTLNSSPHVPKIDKEKKEKKSNKIMVILPT